MRWPVKLKIGRKTWLLGGAAGLLMVALIPAYLIAAHHGKLAPARQLQVSIIDLA